MTNEELKEKCGMVTDVTKLIVTEEGQASLARKARVAAELKVRIRMVKQLIVHNPELAAEAALWLETWSNALDKTMHQVKQVEETEFTAGMKRIGIELIDEKAAQRRRAKEERERRKSEGKCVDCPSDNVRDALPGETRCRECGERHRVRAARYRAKRKQGGERGRSRDTGAEVAHTETTTRQTHDVNADEGVWRPNDRPAEVTRPSLPILIRGSGT